ncbi:glycoside hydrolase family 9 protein [Microbulbifer sp. ALW1]|uniref:glycoside hydrolase family 9 protein n=1 Tax=Microbulbifer sp. (strain ALW1) TaxID=1516059 RepID=UPI0013582E2E|nr:glycoside hydrolase family 9 protein [Microbulbifer sp. ALW1]
MEDVKVHVNQVAVELYGPKSAVVSHRGAPALGQFQLQSTDGKRAYQAALQPLDAFGEWESGRQYYTANFSEVNTAGAYRIAVEFESAEPVLSAPFQILENAGFTMTAAAVLQYFKDNRYTHEEDRNIRIFGSDDHVDVWGGWMDAGGDTGKYLSHLAYSNFLPPQQGAIVPWVLVSSYERIPHLYQNAGLEASLIEEVFWGADYLHRILDPKGFFYMTVFDQWGSGAERMITGYEGLDGVYTENFQAAFREGGGIAIAALAAAARLSHASGLQGEYSGAQYLADAERAFAHLQANNAAYCDDGKENIIDDYTALVAATELYRTTGADRYLNAARQRAASLNERMTADGWMISDGAQRPFYHGVEAGLPILALAAYTEIESDPAAIALSKNSIARALAFQLALNSEVVNPYNYARQYFRAYKDGTYSEATSGFFMPHANETNYWWQGENARLASLSAAAIVGGRLVDVEVGAPYGVAPKLSQFAQNQLDWIFGRNPYDVCMMYGFGVANPPHADSAGSMVRGGISNGITGATASDEGRGITWAEGPDSNDWRWVEQWLQHAAWYLYAVSAMSAAAESGDRVAASEPVKPRA